LIDYLDDHLIKHKQVIAFILYVANVILCSIGGHVGDVDQI